MSVHNGTAASSATRDLGRNFEVEPQREREIRINTIWNAWHMMGQLWKATYSWQRYRSRFSRVYVLFCETKRKHHRRSAQPARSVPEEACEAPRRDDEDKLGH